MRHLRKRLPFWSQLLIGAVTFSVVGITLYFGSRVRSETESLVTEQFNQQQLILARSAAATIEAHFKALTSELQALTNQPEVQGLGPECLRYMQHACSSVLAGTIIRRLDSNGILRFVYPFDDRRVGSIGADYSSTPWFVKVRDTRRPTVSALVTGEDGKPSVLLVAPVVTSSQAEVVEAGGMRGIAVSPTQDSEPGFGGALVASCPLKPIQLIVSPIVSGKTGYAWLLNQDGIFLAHHEADFIGQSAFEARSLRNPQISTGAVNDIQRRMLSSEEGTGRYESGWHRGEKGMLEKLVAFTRVKVADESWSVAVCAPVNEVEHILRQAWRSERLTLGFVVLALLTGGLLLLIVSSRWARYLEREVSRRTKEVRETADYLNSLIQRANAPIVVWNADKTITTFNRAFERLSGRQKEETIGMPLDILFPRSGRPACMERIESVGRGETLDAVEIPIVHKDGSLRFMLWSSGKIHDEDGQLIAMFAQGTDVTERRQMQEALRESEERFRATFEQASVGIMQVSPEGRYINVNRRFCEMLGYDEEELIGHHFSETTHAEDRETCCESFRQLIAGEVESYHAEKRYICRDETSVCVYLTVGLVRAPDGSPVYAVAAAEDITDRKRAEAALRESERRYRLLAENACDVIWVFDLTEKKPVYVSPSVTRMLGYSVEEATCLSKEDLFEPASLPQARSVAEELRSIEPIDVESVSWSRTVELEVRRREGRSLWTETTVTFMHDEMGRATSVLGVMRDISLRKRTEERLLQAEKMEAIGRLAGGVAHDFNNILTAILGNLHLARMSLPEDHPVLEQIEEVQDASSRASGLTQQLLAFSRKQIVAAKSVDLNQVVVNTKNMLRRLIREDIEMPTQLAEDLPAIKADSSQLQQVILNLAINARDAMPNGGKLTIETYSMLLDEESDERPLDVEPGLYVILVVTDTGEGMDADELVHVFEPFYTTKEQGKGVGLGLYTVYGIVSQSGGHISVQSEKGRGTCFKVCFPAVAGRHVQVEKPERKATLTAGKGQIVLVVEDEEGVRNLVERILSRGGYDVRIAANAGEAIRAAEELGDSLSLLLTDVVMPDMGGRDLAEVLTSCCPNLKALFMSGYTKQAISELCDMGEAIELISKPFTPRELLKKVEEVLDK